MRISSFRYFDSDTYGNRKATATETGKPQNGANMPTAPAAIAFPKRMSKALRHEYCYGIFPKLISVQHAGINNNQQRITQPMKAKLATAALLLTSMNFAIAGDFYIVGSIGRATQDVDQSEEDAYVNSTINPVGGRVSSSTLDKTDSAVKLQLGYQFSPNWAVEGGYMDLGKGSYTAHTVTVPWNTPASDVTEEVKLTAWNIAAVGMLPLNDKFSLFGKIGAFRAKAEGTLTVGNYTVAASDSATRAMYGIGVLYNLTQSLGVRAEYEHFNDYGNLFSAGVQAKF